METLDMKAIFFIIAGIVIFTLMTGVVWAENINSGFGGIDWATPREAVLDCEKVEERVDIRYCMRRDQAHTLLGESIPEVLYGFYKDAFFSVFIRVENEEAYQATKARLKDGLGAPETSLDKDGMVAVLRWTRDKVRVELHNDRSVQGFQLAYYYVPIADKAARKHKNVKPGRWPNTKPFQKEISEDQEPIRILTF